MRRAEQAKSELRVLTTLAWLGVAMLACTSAHAALHPLEIRRHWSLEQRLSKLGLPEEVQAEISKDGVPEGSIVYRYWYRTLPSENKLTPEGAVQTQTIVMMDLALDGLRIKWTTDRDFSNGRVTQELAIWKGPERYEVITVRRQHNWKGGDLAGFLEEGRRRRSRGGFADATESRITVSLAGREWTATDYDWSHGKLLPGDRLALDQVLTEDLKNVLELVEAVAQMEANLFPICYQITHPLLGRFDDPCTLHEGAIALASGPADCQFDARFGETCSPAELLASDRTKQPELTRDVDQGP